MRLVSTAQAAEATGRTPVTIRDWARRGLIHSHGRGVYDLHEVQKTHDRIRSTKIAGHHKHLRRVLEDLGVSVVDDILDKPHAYALMVESPGRKDLPA